MAKPGIYRDFMKALKLHWKSALPHVKPLKEPRGILAMASTFYAGVAGLDPTHVFLEFQTHHNRGGLFTINVIIARDEFAPGRGHVKNPDWGSGKFQEGSYRIGRFLDTRHGDKWWPLCWNESPDELSQAIARSSVSEDWWYPKNYDNPATIVQDAVNDVTFSVHLTLLQLGLPGAVAHGKQESRPPNE